MPASKISVAGATSIGGKPRNEDTFFYENFGSDAYLGVLDGHGEYGQEVAYALRDFFAGLEPRGDLAASFGEAEELARSTILENALKKHRRVGQKEADGGLYTAGHLPLRGGTTASLVDICGDRVRVTHTGDSEVMVIHVETGTFTVLTKDHSSTCVDEYKRILATAVKPPRFNMVAITFHTSELRPVFTMAPATAAAAAEPTWIINPLGGFNKCNVRGDWSAYMHGDEESLNMTRALGDFSLKKHGLVYTPDVIEYTLRAGRNIVVTASDGLYDNYTYEALRDLVTASVATGADVVAAARDVLEKGVETGFKNFGAKSQDNTTVVLAIVDVEAAAEGSAVAVTDPVEPRTPEGEPSSP